MNDDRNGKIFTEPAKVICNLITRFPDSPRVDIYETTGSYGILIVNQADTVDVRVGGTLCVEDAAQLLLTLINLYKNICERFPQADEVVEALLGSDD